MQQQQQQQVMQVQQVFTSQPTFAQPTLVQLPGCQPYWQQVVYVPFPVYHAPVQQQMETPPALIASAPSTPTPSVKNANANGKTYAAEFRLVCYNCPKSEQTRAITTLIEGNHGCRVLPMANRRGITLLFESTVRLFDFWVGVLNGTGEYTHMRGYILQFNIYPSERLDKNIREFSGYRAGKNRIIHQREYNYADVESEAARLRAENIVFCVETRATGALFSIFLPATQENMALKREVQAGETRSADAEGL